MSEVQTPSIGESRSDGMRPQRKDAVASRPALEKWFLSWDWRPRLVHSVASRLTAGIKTPLDEHKFFPVNPDGLAAQTLWPKDDSVRGRFDVLTIRYRVLRIAVQ